MIEEIVEEKLLLRYLIDNARSNSANLTDNELVTLLMRLQGCSKSEIARVLEKEPDVPLKRRAVDWLQHQAVHKTLCASGLDETTVLINPRKETEVPKGVYDRSKISKRRKELRALVAEKANGNPPAFSPTVEDVEDLAPAPRAKNNGDGVQPWGQPYEVAATDFEPPSKWEPLYQDALLRLEQTPASKAVVYPFEDDHTAECAYDGVVNRFRKRYGQHFIIAGVRKNPPRLFVRRGPNWSP